MNDNPQLQEGVRAATNNEFFKAEGIFTAMLQQEGHDAVDSQLGASLWSNLGNVHISLGRPEVAAQDYSRAIELAPGAAVPYLNRAIALEELGLKLQRAEDLTAADSKWQEAMADCNAAIERDPKEFAAYFNKGNVEMRLNDFTGAADSFRRAADLAPGIAGYRLRAAQLQFQQGDVAGALRTARGVARKNANYAEAHATIAAVLWSEGQVSAAEGEFEAALELDPHWRDMEYVRANVRWPPALFGAMEKLVTLELPPARG